MRARAGTDPSTKNAKWLRATLERLAIKDDTADIAVFGSLGFWTDGAVLSCRVIAPGAKPMTGFDIPLRLGAI